jgi:hypothetical protein
MSALSPGQRAIRLSGSVLAILSLPVSACGRSDTLVSSEAPLLPADSIAPGDTIPPPPPVHVGIPFGPFHLPPSLYGPKFTGAYLAAVPSTLLANLEAARWANARVLLNFTGHNKWFRDSHGFNLEQWKARVDHFRGLDLSSYIADGTIIGHFIMDEPSDSRDWNGTVVSLEDIDEMARYSKEIWPSMTTIIRAWPAYLEGYHYQYLDAAWAQYNGRRFPDMDAFIAENVEGAKAAGLALVAGLNVLAGGLDGPLGFYRDRHAMSASELRTWGRALMSEPYICAVINWRYNAQYFALPEIQSAFEDLNQKAQTHPKKSCQKER